SDLAYWLVAWLCRATFSVPVIRSGTVVAFRHLPIGRDFASSTQHGKGRQMFSFFHHWLSGSKKNRQHGRRRVPHINRRSRGVERLEDRSMMSVSSFLL